MNVLGISALDTDSTVAIVSNGRVVAAVAEERLSRIKMHAGFPHQALDTVLNIAGMKPNDIDIITYPFYDWHIEASLMSSGYLIDFFKNIFCFNWKSFSALREAMEKEIKDNRKYDIPGLPEDKYYIKKSVWKRLAYEALAGNPVSDKLMHHIFYAVWLKNSCAAHLHFNMELKKALREKKLEAKLKRFDHHKSHAVAAYYTSGFDKALVLTLDAYGSGLAGSVWLGEAGMVRKVAAFRYPNSLGLFYETLTSSLGFKPNRHEGKIVGLAAYGDPHILHDTVISRFRLKDGDFRYINGCNYLFLKNISTKFSKQNIASAYQSVLEEIMSGVTEYFSAKFGIENVAISGGVTANVKLNQRIFETKGIKNIFIFPDMGDGGTCVGGALMPFVEKGLKPYRLKDVYFGPEYSEPEMRKCLEEAGLNYERVDNIERRIAELLAQNKIVARFDGRMEFGPRALGNRSVMYQAKDPGINQWLNKQLGRTEFMPFAPVTLYEKRDMCYKNIEGAEYAAEFMTITCDCTSWMSKNCPAAVHVDNTARPQLIKRETNPGYYKILEEYYKLTGIPTVINTSFNMHEEPIVCTPFDAIRAFKLGKLHYMAMGNFLIQGE